MVTAAELAAVDAFFADRKTLYGDPPEFGPTKFHRKGLPEWNAVWPIADSLGIMTGGQLRFVTRPGLERGPTIAVILNQRCVARLDLAPADECETNPLWAQNLNLPARVCGVHYHGWEHNRAHVEWSGEWELPCRMPLPPQIRRFEQAFPWFADRINLEFGNEQRTFELPSRLI